jgi:hypothetical protein
MFTVLHPITLVLTGLARHFTSKTQEGRIRLPPDEEPGELHGGREVRADWS